MAIQHALQLLRNYSGPHQLTLHQPASESLINNTEALYGFRLPEDLKTFYRFTDGFEVDEDIFNMIPLTEALEKLEGNKLMIAEYMIYSDMWSLDLNADDPEAYNIINHSDETVLTNSLGEFIAKFLDGGVFETGGLYHWSDQIKARIFGNTDINVVKPKISVFYRCLKLGLASKEEIINWANWIISTESSAHDFFVDISLSKDEETLLETLQSIGLTQDILQIRVIFGIISTHLIINKITKLKAAELLVQFIDEEGFTPYEISEMRQAIAYKKTVSGWFERRSVTKFEVHLEKFFDNYRDFNTGNYETWGDINRRLVESFLNKS